MQCVGDEGYFYALPGMQAIDLGNAVRVRCVMWVIVDGVDKRGGIDKPWCSTRVLNGNHHEFVLDVREN